MKTFLFFLAIPLLGQAVVVNPKAITLNCLAADGTISVATPCTPPAILSAQSWMVTQLSGNTTTLNGAVLSGATSVTVVDASNINGNGSTEILIDGEAYNVTAKAAKVLTVTPADLGTTTAAHANGATVQILKYSSGGSGTTIANLISNMIQATGVVTLQAIMDQFPGGVLATQAAAIQTANQVKATGKANAAQ